MSSTSRSQESSSVNSDVQTQVWLVGAGPGSIDLLTIKAMRLLTVARWVLYDALVSEDILALAKHAKLIPVGKRAAARQAADLISARQVDINALLVETAQLAAREGGIVVRLKGGDPLIFARADEEIVALQQAGIDFQVVPGITAAQAAHAHIRQPLTHRGENRSFVLTTPTVQQGDEIGIAWARPLVAAKSGAVYMAAASVSRVKATLLALGLPASTPVTWVINAGRPTAEQVVQSLGGLNFPLTSTAPAILLVGNSPWNPSFTSSVSPAQAHWSDSLSV